MTDGTNILIPRFPSSGSQAGNVYASLRAGILSGVFLPGRKMKVVELAKQLEVSPGAVREALSRLVPEGLVLFREQRGFSVAPVSVEDLDDLTQLRCDMTELAVRRSLANGGAEWEASVLAAAHHLRRTPKSLADGTHNPEWTERHNRFHETVTSACNSQHLLTILGQLQRQSERYRALSAHIVTSRDVDAEHQALVDAALDRDADQLVRLTNEHFRKTALIIRGAFSTVEDSGTSSGSRPETSVSLIKS